MNGDQNHKKPKIGTMNFDKLVVKPCGRCTIKGTPTGWIWSTDEKSELVAIPCPHCFGTKGVLAEER